VAGAAIAVEWQFLQRREGADKRMVSHILQQMLPFSASEIASRIRDSHLQADCEVERLGKTLA